MAMQQVFTYIAWGSSTLFLFKLFLLTIGGDHGDSDIISDTSDGHAFTTDGDSDIDFKLFSVQSFLAFLMGLGWLGQAALVEWKWTSPAALAAGGLFGFAMMCFSALLMNQLRRLNSHYTPDIRDCIGLTGQTYLPIPESGVGQIEILFGGKIKILDAKSDSGEIPQFYPIEVLAVRDGILVVKATQQFR